MKLTNKNNVNYFLYEYFIMTIFRKLGASIKNLFSKTKKRRTNRKKKRTNKHKTNKHRKGMRGG